jgi:hypothetical protein
VLARACEVMGKERTLTSSISIKGKRKSYIITPEALAVLYKNHLPKILARGSVIKFFLRLIFNTAFRLSTRLASSYWMCVVISVNGPAYAVLNRSSQDNEEDNAEEDDEEYPIDLEADIADGTDS